MPIQRGGLQVQEEEEQSASSLLKPHVLTGAAAWGPCTCRPAGRASRGACKGKEAAWMLPWQCNCSQPGLQPCCKYPFELVGSVCFFFLFFFPTLRKWLQKYWSGKVILFYFFVLFPPLFPFNQKEIPSWNPSPPFMQNWKWQYLIIAIMI